MNVTVQNWMTHVLNRCSVIQISFRETEDRKECQCQNSSTFVSCITLNHWESYVKSRNRVFFGSEKKVIIQHLQYFTTLFCFITILFDIWEHVLDFSVYLWGRSVENAGRGCDEVSNKQCEARQSEEEETRRTGTDDGVQNILMTSKHINWKQRAISTLISLSIITV